MSELRPELLVALGDADGFGAVDWAVERALRSGLDLCLVHVVHPPRGLAGPENLLLSFDAVELVGRQIVRAAMERIEDSAGGVLTVRTAVPTGHAVGVLVRMAAGCATVVTQHHPAGNAAQIFGGSVPAGVASRVDTPVVSVPHDWVPRPTPAGGGLEERVTVGVAGVEDDALIEHALAGSADGESCVTLLHALHVSAAYELALMPPDFEAGLVEREAKVLNDVAEPWRARYPGVQVETRLMRGRRPASALVDASHASDHVVIGRSHPHRVRYLGSVAAALLRHSACPVEVVPPSTARTTRT